MQNTQRPEWVRVGQKVTTSGYAGTITRLCDWSEAIADGRHGMMVEIRLASGTTCVSYHNAIPVGK